MRQISEVLEIVRMKYNFYKNLQDLLLLNMSFSSELDCNSIISICKSTGTSPIFKKNGELKIRTYTLSIFDEIITTFSNKYDFELILIALGLEKKVKHNINIEMIYICYTMRGPRNMVCRAA